ncbi:AsmA-like C-terminal region-containing protein [Parasedimentitalea huanghaiensis]|uniref:DUF3971 domain-containing protein n=1 Tax=Parasedimentitalea huanghaiensis TaxID=2682100 RepID=A0A6L6WA75_9RHOB|nr:AsmA-like C-terminal region-containing protein [Zongyanglinia huanghaiensis]MVO14716.1 DUF3971 domain-containing protein [Zongyanglinia huanghaiensis]
MSPWKTVGTDCHILATTGKGKAKITRAQKIPGPGPEHQEPSLPGVKRTRWRMLRVGVWLLSGVTLLLAGFVYFAMGARFDAPDWLRQRVETRIERNLAGMQIEFGQIYMVVNHGWRPRVGLRDVRLSAADGTVMAQLADAQASLAMRPLLSGQVQPKRISISGLFATLRREASGAMALSLEGGAAPVRQAAGLPQLIEQFDQLLMAPALSALDVIETEALTLRYEDDRQGRGWTLDGGHIELDRTGENVAITGGFSLLSGRDYVGTVEANYSSKIGDAAAEFGVLVREIASEDIASQSAALGWLQVLRAPISGSLRGGIDSNSALLPFSASLQIGSGVLQPADQTLPIPFHGASSYISFTPETQILQFDELRVNSGWGAGAMEGQALLSGVENGQLTELVGQVRFSDLSLNPRGLYETPLELAGISADFKLELNPFRLRIGEMLVRDGDSNILVSGALRAGDLGWDYDVIAQVDQVEADRVKQLWPEAAPPKPRKWVRENLWQGTARDINLALRGRDGKKPFLYLDLGFEDAVVRFQKNLPPLRNAQGQMSIFGKRLVLMATGGTVTADQGGDIDVAGTSFIIPDMSVKRGAPGVARVVGTGSVTSVLSLLNRPPLSVLKDSNLPVDLAKGLVSVAGTLSLPLREKVPVEEIFYHYQGRISDVESNVLVPGHALQATSLSLSGDQNGVDIGGKGQLSGVPISAKWRMALGKDVPKASRVEGRVELSQMAVDAFGLGLPKGSISGQATGEFAVDLKPEQAPLLSLQSDLSGAGLRIPSLSWAMSPEATGTLNISARLGELAQVDLLELQAPGLSVSGTLSTREGGGLDRAQFGQVKVGNWLTGSAELVGRGNAAPSVNVTGGALDMRKTPFSGASGAAGTSGGNTPITLTLGRLQVTDSIALHGFRGKFSTLGGFSGQFSGALNGQTAISGQVVPQNGGVATRIRSNDAGGVFRSAGMLGHGRGGSFDMTLTPASKPGEYDGRIKVKNTRIKDAPAMAALINSLSLIGLVDELAGQGILFTGVEASFRLGPSYLILHKSSAVGPSIGLSMDGNFDLARGVLNMRGVVSPIYMLNAIGSVLTRKGEGLIGFAYTLRGTADEPQVQVNPLSGLAPGMFREIFRGPAPRIPGQPEPAAPTPGTPPSPYSSPAEDR